MHALFALALGRKLAIRMIARVANHMRIRTHWPSKAGPKSGQNPTSDIGVTAFGQLWTKS